MASAAARMAGGRLRGGLVVSPAAAGVAPGHFEVIAGGHPVPTAGSEAAGRRALDLAGHVPGEGERLLVLLSGGASALMAVPAAGLTLEDKRQTTAVLLREGADIGALNTVRKHLSAIKGGWLAAAASADCRTLAVSDVVGDDPSLIGSGPTVADASTFEDAIEALNRFGGAAAYPARVVSYLAAGARGERPETPGPGDQRLARAETFVIGSRRDAMRGAAGGGRAGEAITSCWSSTSPSSAKRARRRPRICDTWPRSRPAPGVHCAWCRVERPRSA